MMITLRDERGSPLSKASAHAYRPPRPVLLDFTTRPDALFRYYFDHSGRSVVVAIGATIWMGSLATRWRMGVRSWFLHDLRRLRVAAVERDSSNAEVAPGPVVGGGRRAADVAADRLAAPAEPAGAVGGSHA